MEHLYYQESAAKKLRKLETEGKSFFIIGGANAFFFEAGADYGDKGNN